MPIRKCNNAKFKYNQNLYKMTNELERTILEKAQSWIDGSYDEATKKQVKYLMDNDIKELTESFYKDLEFGTGGLRGIMGVGTNS